MDRRISAAEAAREFAEFLNRVQHQGTSFVIESGGKAVARLVPAAPRAFTGAALLELLRSVRHPDPGFADDLEEITRGQPPVAGSPWEH